VNLDKNGLDYIGYITEIKRTTNAIEWRWQQLHVHVRTWANTHKGAYVATQLNRTDMV